MGILELERTIGTGFFHPGAKEEILERTLMAKWVSFSELLFHSWGGTHAPELLAKRKSDIANFYLSNPKVHLGLEKKLANRAEFESSVRGDATDELGMFFGSFCSQIVLWSKLMGHIASEDLTLASKEVAAYASRSAILNEGQEGKLQSNISEVLSHGGNLSGTLDSLLACRQILAPLIVEHDFSISKSANEYVSSRINPIEPFLRLPSSLRNTLHERDKVKMI